MQTYGEAQQLFQKRFITSPLFFIRSGLARIFPFFCKKTEQARIGSVARYSAT